MQDHSFFLISVDIARISLPFTVDSQLIFGFIVFPCLQGESFYNPYIPGVMNALNDQGLIEESQGARVIFIEGFNIPLIVVKSDGGYNYASTDLTALWLVICNCLFT